MTSRSNRTLEGIARRVAVPEPAYERMLRRRDHNRRSQRIGAGAVGITVFVAMVWIVTTGGPFDSTGKTGEQPGTSVTTIPSVAPSATNAPPVEPTPPPSAGGPLTTAPWVGASALPGVDYVIDLNTGATTPLPDAIIRSSLRTDEGSVGPHYAVSRDGSQLAYVGAGDDGVPQIFVAGIDGSRVRQVTHDPVGADWPAWSPDGTRIAYLGGSSSSDLVSDRDLLVLDVATGASTKIADGVAFPSGLQFTPDGSSLVYTGPNSNLGIGREMRTVPLAGGQSTILFGGGHRGVGDAGSGSLSPDGSLVTMIGYLVDGPGAARFVVKADGTALRYVRGFGSNPGGMWSPDGRRIVCLGPDRQDGGMIVIDVVTGDTLLVAEGSEAIWLDGQTLLVSV
jgi:Tol biopolymer transport system component